jgi:3-hydroxymyristoyl/3-hydroxydecanoyl-(acyl carrier protein) dehydratase
MDINRTLHKKISGASLRLLAILDEAMAQTNAIHQSLLENQSKALAVLSTLRGIAARKENPMPVRAPLFSRQQLEEFASGSVAACFGPDYAVLDQRKTPRIPNGRLLLIDRIVDISGTRGEPQPPASITSQVEIPADAWYLQEKGYPQIPLAILMEMALQPCGILSAYLGTSLILPPQNNLFRNLDGDLHFSAMPDLRGKTVTNQAQMTRSLASGGLYIQAYNFVLSVDGVLFVSGESSFGYFTPETMGKQSGLDTNEKRAMLIENENFPQAFKPLKSIASKGERGLLDLFDSSWVDPRGGRYSQGVVVGRKELKADEWFYSNHFYQDPVMPGSLGVEAITRGLWDFVQQEFPEVESETHMVEFMGEPALRWKYRGQVLPTNKTTYFEIHIKKIERSSRLPAICADADFWVDGMRIYSIENLNMTLKASRMQ